MLSARSIGVATFALVISVCVLGCGDKTSKLRGRVTVYCDSLANDLELAATHCSDEPEAPCKQFDEHSLQQLGERIRFCVVVRKLSQQETSRKFVEFAEAEESLRAAIQSERRRDAGASHEGREALAASLRQLAALMREVNALPLEK